MTSTKPNLANVGNPMAGLGGGVGGIPSTGGNGGNAGGPKGSADGSAVVGGQVIAGAGAAKPTGTASAPAAGEEQVACGAPGQPRCAIDETGTPTAVDSSIARSADAFKASSDSLRESASGSADKSFFAGWNVFFSAPALVTCVPIALPRDMGAIDPCPVVEGVRFVMGYAWALAALMLCLSMIKKVV